MSPYFMDIKQIIYKPLNSKTLKTPISNFIIILHIINLFMNILLYLVIIYYKNCWYLNTKIDIVKRAQ